MMREQKAAYRITDLNESDRPRERLAQYGADKLSDAELLAILLGIGVRGENAVQVGHRLLFEFRGLAGLQRADYKEVCSQHGIGPAKAAQIKAAIELGRRLSESKPDERKSINSPKDAADLVRYDMAALEQECDD
jgi:DNA repair protein RadC